MIKGQSKQKPGRDLSRALPRMRGDVAALLDTSNLEILKVGEKVRAARHLRNDGTYPHADVGAILVQEGDVGYVLEIVKFGGRLHYTVEFVERAVVLGTRRWDLARSSQK